MIHENIAKKNNLLMDVSAGTLFYFELLSDSEIKKYMSKKDKNEFEQWKKDNDVSDIFKETKVTE